MLAQDLHLVAMEKLERDLGRKHKNASQALKQRLRESRAAREAMCVSVFTKEAVYIYIPQIYHKGGEMHDIQGGGGTMGC